MARSVKKPWTGKSDDSKAPPRVRLRVFDAYKGICYLCRLPIKPTETWELEHRVAIVNGGANAEGNMAPAHKHCHVAKSGRDLAEKSKVAKTRKKHLGITRPKQSIRSRNDLQARAPKQAKAPMLPRQLYEARNDG